MNRSLFVFIWFMAVQVGRAETGPEWLTDVKTAKERAQQEKKAILLDFTGSDWCGWCIKLKNEVLDQPEFREFAKTNLILVEVDFPHRKQLEPAQQEANKSLAATYHVSGYPTLVLLNREGQPLDDIEGYLPGGPHPFIQRLAHLLNVEVKNQPSETTEPAPKPVVFQPVPQGVPIRYETLALKGISGSKQRRMALINNATLFVGETATVKVQDQRVEVCCKEIRDDSVLITVDGKLRELKLAGQ